MSDIDYWELNEAFSVVDIVNKKLLNLDPERWVVSRGRWGGFRVGNA